MKDVVDRAADMSEEGIERMRRAVNAFWREAGHDSLGPWAKPVAQSNMELAAWMAKRSRAYAELPTRLLQCATPNDALAAQSRFMQDMVRDYQVLANAMIECCTEAVSSGREKGRPGEQ